MISDYPINEHALRPDAMSGCLLVYLVGWWLTCAFVTGAAMGMYW